MNAMDFFGRLFGRRREQPAAPPPPARPVDVPSAPPAASTAPAAPAPSPAPSATPAVPAPPAPSPASAPVTAPAAPQAAPAAPQPKSPRPVPPGKHILPDWERLIATNPALWAEAKARAEHGPRVLIATNVSGHSPATVVESALAAALTLRGAHVQTLVCDQVMPACLRAQNDNVLDQSIFERYELPSVLCGGCSPVGEYTYGPLELPYHRFSQLLSQEERAQARRIADETPLEAIPSLEIDGLPIGEHAYAGALRFFARGDIENEERGELLLRRYLEASVQAASVTRNLLQQERFDAACVHHGIYVPQGITSAVANQAGLRVSTWNPAYRTGTFVFSHRDTYHHTLLDEPTESWETMPWTPEMEQEILAYLKSRWGGSRDWIWFHDKPDEDFAGYAREVGLDLNKPIIGMLSNVIWDAQLHYRANAFSTMLDWVLQTFRYVATRPDLQLVIRVHPAEIRGTARSRQPLVDEIAKAFPDGLPPNIFVIPPESQVSTYAAMTQANAVIIYGTKTGVELTSMGIPTIVAGEAWIRNKGLTLDASSPEEYFRILDTLPLAGRMPPEQVTRARKYAYHFFFRRMVPLPFMRPSGGWPPYEVGIESLDDLLPGHHPGLDVLCDGILEGTPFIYPAEELGLHDR